jgi:hypothetical protein
VTKETGEMNEVGYTTRIIDMIKVRAMIKIGNMIKARVMIKTGNRIKAGDTTGINECGHFTIL